MKALLSVAAVAASILTAAPASATVLDFEGVTQLSCCETMPNGYGGLDWQNFYIIKDTNHPGTGYQRGVISGEFAGFNGNGLPASITATADAFSFDGGWFTSAWYEGNELVIEGFSDGDAVADYSLTVTLNTQTPLFLDVNWTGLQRLRFTSSRDHFAVDDLRINEGVATEVPEPLTIGLLGMGLLGVAGARRRKA